MVAIALKRLFAESPGQAMEHPTGFYTDANGVIHPLFDETGANLAVRSPSKGNPDTWAKRLTRAERKSIDTWEEDSSRVRAAARGKFEGEHAGHTSELVHEHNLFVNTIHKAPSYSGDVHRGMGNLSAKTLRNLASAKEFTSHAPTSFSPHKDVAEEFLGKFFTEPGQRGGPHSAMFTVLGGHQGAHIHPSEVVIPEGHHFRVVSSTIKPTSSEHLFDPSLLRRGSMTAHITLEEVKAPTLPVRRRTRLATWQAIRDWIIHAAVPTSWAA